MGKGLFSIIKDKMQNKNKINTENISKNNTKNLKAYINQINSKTDSILMLAEPQIFSLAKENNIAFKYNENILITKDGNLCVGLELGGVSYSSLTPEEELELFNQRNIFFNKINSDLEINIVIQKEKINLTHNSKSSNNIYANEIIEKWENHKEVYKVNHYLLISTKNKQITGALESIKNSSTKEKDEESENINTSFEAKKELVNNIINEAKFALERFKPRQMSADEIINFYATYSNAQTTNFKYSRDLITDCYISSDVEFKKDYINFYRNDGKTMFARFISVKAYETDYIKSYVTTKVLKSNNDFTIFINLTPYTKEKAIKKVKDTLAFAPEIAKEELSGVIELIRADRENLILTSYSIYILAENLQDLEAKTNELKAILENQNLNVVRETINQKALYFSFFPSRSNLNARKRTLKISNVSTIANFEKDLLGFEKNDWGNEPVTIFRHLSDTPFLFNFHFQPNGDKPVGHTMIIGGTGAGKTTLAQFLMCNLYKYDIDIFSMDKLRGMHNFSIFTDGEYHDSDFEFKLNPFALDYTLENREFLIEFLRQMANIDKNQYEAINNIQKTLDRMYEIKQENDIFSLSNFIEALPNEDDNLKARLQPYKNSIFDNKEDALNFTKQLSILNMDTILKNSTLASLTAFYIFHRLKNSAKNSKKRGFFCFIDELKDFLLEDSMRESILEAILEVRKIGGVMCMGFQNLSFFDDIEKGASFLDNIANFIIYPTTNIQSLENMKEKIGLTDTEIKFLQEAGTNSRQVLLKMKLRNESAILNVDLSRLGKHLKVFSSSSDNVKIMKGLKHLYPNQWREMYLNEEYPQNWRELFENINKKESV